MFTVMVDAAKTDSTMFELESRSGVDGRMVFFPSNWKTSMGVDGGMVSLLELYNLVNENQMVDFLKFIVK